MTGPSRSSEPFPAEGLPLEDARRRILEAVAARAAQAGAAAAGAPVLPAAEHLPLAAALGRVSAEPVLAPAAVPGFRAAILDGYAVAEASVPQLGHTWPVVGRSAPGAPFRRAAAPGADPGPDPDRLRPGEAIRILTGAPLPEGATRVLAQELVERLPAASPGAHPEAAAERPPAWPQAAAETTPPQIRLAREASANPWIRAADEEAAPGQELLAAGVRLRPADLGRLAGCGVAALALRPRPRIGLLVSGDELVPAGQPRGPGQIWESNGTLLEALLARLGYGVAERRVVGDAPEALRAALLELAGLCDVVVSTGGVSAGDSDWIRPLLAELGAVDFWKLFLKPGRPFAFGELGGKPFFGLPGNPVAAAITALQLLWPALQALEGAEPQQLPRLKVRLAADLKRGPGRPELARARLQVGPEGELLALVEGSQASSRIGSLQGADLLLEIPAEAGSLAAGSQLWAQLLRLPMV